MRKSHNNILIGFTLLRDFMKICLHIILQIFQYSLHFKSSEVKLGQRTKQDFPKDQKRKRFQNTNFFDHTMKMAFEQLG